jgi:hypothetical protein
MKFTPSNCDVWSEEIQYNFDLFFKLLLNLLVHHYHKSYTPSIDIVQIFKHNNILINIIESLNETNITKIHGFSKGPRWLTSLFLLVDMYILTISLGLEWHMYFSLINLFKMTYLVICQIEHLIKFDKT